jgi:uncharacterized protein (DUF2345 family)
MTPDAQNSDIQDPGRGEALNDRATAGGHKPVMDGQMSEPDQVLAATDAITGEYWGLDELQQRQDASVCNNSIGTGAYKAGGAAYVNVFGEADLIAIGQARVYGSGHARIAAGQNATVVATEQTKVTASGKVAVCATGAAKVYASDDVTVAALDRSEVYATGRVKIRAFGSSTIYASGDSLVEVAEETVCTVYLYGNARQIVAPTPE